MGYYSQHTIEIKDAEGNDVEDHTDFYVGLQEDVKVLNLKLDYDVDDIIMSLDGEDVKWYGMIEDFELISSLPRFKDWKFKITREGEENGDADDNYFTNGTSITSPRVMISGPVPDWWN